jgi:hypothetical protein
MASTSVQQFPSSILNALVYAAKTRPPENVLSSPPGSFEAVFSAQVVRGLGCHTLLWKVEAARLGQPRRFLGIRKMIEVEGYQWL